MKAYSNIIAAVILAGALLYSADLIRDTFHYSVFVRDNAIWRFNHWKGHAQICYDGRKFVEGATKEEPVSSAWCGWDE
jgi:hypothetical protein